MKESIQLVFITAPNDDTAKQIAQVLVGEHLVACVNIVPRIFSIYRWEGKIEQGDEVLMICKTTLARVGDLKKRVKELHPYDVPELLALAVGDGLEAYMDWVVDAVRM